MVVRGRTPLTSHNLKYGIPRDLWNAAKEEARTVMIEVARRGCTVSYSDLVQRIGAYQFGPQDPPFHHLLGEISTAENAAGRGMLSVLVVHKDGDKRPGPGFFKLRN